MKLIAKKQWLSLLEEYRCLYNPTEFDEEPVIREHKEKVIRRIEKSAADLELSFRSPGQKPVCKYLSSVIEAEADSSYSSLINLIGKVKDTLTWEYGYEELPAKLKEKYAYAEIMGPEGPVIGRKLILGLVLLAPYCLYPEHSTATTGLKNLI